MADKEQDYRIFIGGLSRDVTERQLESTFGRFGKIVDCQIMLERDTGRPRGFGFLTFSDSRAMDDAIRDMHGRELGDRTISVNRAQPKGADDPPHSHRSYAKGGGRESYGGRDNNKPTPGQGDCFKCGRPGHWARDCPSADGGRAARQFSPPRPRYGGRGDHYVDDRDRWMDDRYERGRYNDRDHYDVRDDRYGGGRDRYINDRYAPVGDRIAADRYGAPPERYPNNGYGKERGYDRDGGARGGGGDRYGGGGGPARYDGRSYRERPTPYDHPPPRRGGRPLSSDRY